MSQTILIESNEDLKKIFALNLTTFVGTEVIVRKDGDDALALLKLLPEISLIIVRARVGDEETAIKIHQYIRNEFLLHTSMIVLGECPELASEVLCLKDPVSWELLIKHAAETLNVSLPGIGGKVRPDYLPVGLHYFNDIKQTPCDIYIRIKKGPNEYQFVKRINSSEVFDAEAIARYEAQGLKEFYVAKDYIQYFTTFVTNKLVQRLEKTDLSLEDRILTTANSYEIVRDSVEHLGLDQSSVDLAEASINSMIKSLKDSPEVANLLKMLFSNKVAYAYQHCHLVALMCHYILSRQNWYKPEHLYTLSFVSFFSDITLRSHQQIRISSLKDLAASQLSDEEKQQVLYHAKDAVKILENYPDSSATIQTVILQSHGTLDGVGFDDNPSEDLHALSKVYIVADSFVKILLEPGLPKTKKEILPILFTRFTNPTYQKIVKALEMKFQ